jgi:glyoxylase-like metal-dependent hydrolase (beta-lactamase superfamily II)
MEIRHLALGMVNAYLAKNNGGWFLIDTGVAMGRAKFEKALARESVTPADIKLVIITHGDLDHTGNCAYLQKKYGLKIAVHEADAEMCRAGTTNFNRTRKASPLSKVLRPLLFALVMKPIMKRFPLEPFEPAIILSDGQNLMHYGFDATVKHVPGHTMGSIGILTADGDFFSGDTILNRKKPTVADTVQDESALAKSIEKIRAMRITNVFPGHGKPFPMAEMTF